MSDLRERVARAVEVIIRYAVEPDARANEMTADELAMIADAAIAICMEEAARVAEGNGLRQYTGKPLIDEIAAAIRAFIGEKS